MCKNRPDWLKVPSRGLVFLSLAMETTKSVPHQTGFFLHLSTRRLLVELEVVKINI